MNKNISNKIYYRIEFTLASSLAVGSGDNTYTDKDIIRDSNDRPYVPGTSLAGVYRSLFDDKMANKYFGFIIPGKNTISQESKIITYDASLVDKEMYVSKRDCVGLDQFRTAIDGRKFDFEVLEPGVKFVTYIEENLSEGDADIAEDIAKAWQAEDIKLGAKTMRGYGCVKDVDIRKKSFDFSDTKAVDEWLSFDMYDDTCWTEDSKWKAAKDDYSYREDDKAIDITLDLVQEGPLIIRVYTTEISDNKDISLPDYKQISYMIRENGKEILFIPGTAWAGVFRHRIGESKNINIGNYFGRDGKDKCKSRIFFSESPILDVKTKEIPRNAIDRFTGGTVDTALFKEKIAYGGKTQLKITVNTSCDKEFIHQLASAIVDLHMGFLTVGGEASIGYGIFSIKSMLCNGGDIKIPTKDEIMNTPERVTDLYNDIVAAMEGK